MQKATVYRMRKRTDLVCAQRESDFLNTHRCILLFGKIEIKRILTKVRIIGIAMQVSLT